MSQPKKNHAVILKTSSDWRKWIEVIKSSAIGQKIWDYIDPETSLDMLPKLEEPSFPQPQDVQDGAIRYSELSDDSKEQYRDLKRLYTRQINLYDQKVQAIGAIRTTIQESILETILEYTFDYDTPYEMLQSLQKRLKPTEQSHKYELLDQYKAIQKPSKGSIEDWLQKWESIYT